MDSRILAKKKSESQIPDRHILWFSTYSLWQDFQWLGHNDSNRISRPRLNRFNQLLKDSV